MRSIVVLVLATMLFASNSRTAYSHNTDDTQSRERCDKTKRKIRKIQSRMRQGYNASQGIKLEEKLRELRQQRKKQCS